MQYTIPLSPAWQVEPVHDRLDELAVEPPHELVTQREVEARLTGVALATGAAAQLVVDAARLVVLCAEHVEPTRGAHLLGLGRDLRLHLPDDRVPGRFVLLAPLDRVQIAGAQLQVVTSTRLLVRRDSGVRRLADLRGRSVALTRGTTNAVAMRALAERRGLALRFFEVADHPEAMQLFATGRVDAVANDDVLLRTWLAAQPQRSLFRITDEALSYEPYAIAYRRDDPQFAVVVDHAFRRLAADRELARLYDRWFMRRLPSGELLRLPMTPQLETAFEALGQPSP